MDKILALILLFALTLHFLYKEKPQFTSKKDEQNTTQSAPQIEINTTIPQILDFENNESEQNTSIEEDDVSLDSILPNLKELLSKFKEEEPVFRGFNPYVSQSDDFISNEEPHYFALDTLPQTPQISLKDLHFKRQSKRLSLRLFETNDKGKMLWHNEVNWQLWRKKGGSNTHALISGVFYLYQNEDKTGYLSDELSISLQKNKKDVYFLSIITPKHYINKAIQDFKIVDEYFIFKLGERKFIIAYLFNENFTKWWECELVNQRLKSVAIGSKGFEIFSNDTNAYEMRLSENETH